MTPNKSQESSEHKLPVDTGELITEASPYIRTMHMFFANSEELGRRIEAREWDGISKPLAAGSGSVGFTAVILWFLGENPNIGKFHESIIEIIKDWQFFFTVVGFLIVAQLVAKRGIALHTFISTLIVTIYALAFFLFPFFAGLSVFIHFSKSYLSLGEWPGLLTFMLLASLSGYILCHSYPRCLSGAFGQSNESVFGTLLVFIFVAGFLQNYL